MTRSSLGCKDVTVAEGVILKTEPGKTHYVKREIVHDKKYRVVRTWCVKQGVVLQGNITVATCGKCKYKRRSHKEG